MVDYGALPVKATFRRVARAFNTIYQNTSGRPKLISVLCVVTISVSGQGYDWSGSISPDNYFTIYSQCPFGVIADGGVSPVGVFYGSVRFVVPDGWYYRIWATDGGGAPYNEDWTEIEF